VQFFCAHVYAYVYAQYICIHMDMRAFYESEEVEVKIQATMASLLTSTSHMNESSHILLGHVAYEWVISHMNESCHP